jgi:hypothetical protein
MAGYLTSDRIAITGVLVARRPGEPAVSVGVVFCGD